ncbi:C2H2 domain-containing protein [Lizonia empirigonia]|nr:C2H2 domain-containing protein [Lizonia empirigonia]
MVTSPSSHHGSRSSTGALSQQPTLNAASTQSLSPTTASSPASTPNSTPGPAAAAGTAFGRVVARRQPPSGNIGGNILVGNVANIGNASPQGGALPFGSTASSAPRPSSGKVRDALRKFKARLLGPELTDFQYTTVEDLRRKMRHIKTDQECRRDMVNMRRMEGCIEAMNHFGKVIEVFLNVEEAVAFVWGPMKFLLMTASEVIESFDTLLDAYEQIGEQMPSLSSYERLFGDDDQLKGALEHILIRFQEYQHDVAELNVKLDKLVAEEQEYKLRVVTQWLAVGQQSQQDHDIYRQIRSDYSTTTHWIVQNEHIKQWLDDAAVPPTPVLWMHGIPGAGTSQSQIEGNGLTTAFYHDDDGASSSAVGILKGITQQLLCQNPQILAPCYTRCTASGEPVLRSPPLATRLLEDICTLLSKLYIIVDGLDECVEVERKQAMEALMNIVGSCEKTEPGKLRILFVSQHMADIKRVLYTSSQSKPVPRTIQLSDADNESDIKAYVRIWVNRIATKYAPFSNDAIEYLQSLTVCNAKGMFLYAKLVLQNLHAQPTRGDLIEGITRENFPGGLRGAEIQVALSIDVDNQTIEYDDRHLRKHIHEICGSLVLLNGDRVSLVHNIHGPSIECELAALCLRYLTFPCFDLGAIQDPQELKELVLEGHLAFQDYAIAKWFHHINAFVSSGSKFLHESRSCDDYLEDLSIALEDFMTQHDDTDWDEVIVEECRANCDAFKGLPCHDKLKGFDARHEVSIKSLAAALDRNRKLLEELPSSKVFNSDDLARYCKFYDHERLFKCTKITCRYFSEGFKDSKARKKHVNIHERPFCCEVPDCLGNEGFGNSGDLQRHIRAFHPEMSDLAETFNSVTIPRARTGHACAICGKTFTRGFARRNHENSHRGVRPHACPECGKAFTRANDLKRHQKLHERA